ncbi:MAG: GNAT family N-acetyltransferase [Faecalimonas sp.]|nr:GNAT family N-acetyltransferase [Faecalimonas sp.]
MSQVDLNKKYEFRSVFQEEVEQTVDIEQICFPPHEACSPKMMRDRVALASDFFLVAVDRETGKIAGFLNGIATNEEKFRDEFFVDANLHNPDGRMVMILGLNVLPEYRMQGLAREIMTRYLQREKERGRKRAILTCLDEKIAMYEKMGYQKLGLSASVWGGEVWYDMSYELG